MKNLFKKFRFMAKINFFDIGLTLGFVGIFLWSTLWILSKAELLPQNHPYVQESFHYENL